MGGAAWPFLGGGVICLVGDLKISSGDLKISSGDLKISSGDLLWRCVLA